MCSGVINLTLKTPTTEKAHRVIPVDALASLLPQCPYHFFQTPD